VRAAVVVLVAAVLVAGCDSGTASSTTAQRLIGPPVRAVGQKCHSINGRADRTCTPGLVAHTPEVEADAPKYTHTLCQPTLPKGQKRWIAKRRPPTAYTNRIKQSEMPLYGYSGDPALYEEDHIVPLSLDGDQGYTAFVPSGMAANLYPELWEGTTGAHVKDKEENSLHSKVCSGALTLPQAQAKILADWTK
jgi:hypothetical protein